MTAVPGTRGPLIPFAIRSERRLQTPRWMPLASTAVAILAAFVLSGLLIALIGGDPFATFNHIAKSAFGDLYVLSDTLVKATPLIFTGLACALAFRMKLWNIGAEGQLLLGAWGASAVVLSGVLPAGTSPFVYVPLMIVFGSLCGALWGGIAGWLKARFNVNEIITTLMLNYIAINLATYLVFGSKSYWRKLDGSGLMFPQGKPLETSTNWPAYDFGNFTVPFGFALGTLIAIGLYVLFRRTRYGFQVRVIGDEPRAARFAGLRTRRTILALMALSGAVAGLGGASDVGDTRHQLDPKALRQAGYGYAGIVVAALARLNPLAVVFTSILMGGLANAGRALQGVDFPAGLVGTLQGLLLVCTLAGELFVRYRVRRVAPTHDHEPDGTPDLEVAAA